MTNRVEKFVNCRSKDPSVRELYIVEGDSALTSVKLGRDAEFQAVIPVRGKTLNCMKADYDQIFKSEIITDLLRVIGCGVELSGTQKVKTDMVAFDLSALSWSKIIICTDADEDGFQIRTLLLTLFYRLLPTLIKEEKIYIAETPLYEITCKDKTYFAYDEFERAQITKKLEGKKYTLQRSKGLGENTPTMMSVTTMHPATRRLVLVSPTDAHDIFIELKTHSFFKNGDKKAHSVVVKTVGGSFACRIKGLCDERLYLGNYRSCSLHHASGTRAAGVFRALSHNDLARVGNLS